MMFVKIATTILAVASAAFAAALPAPSPSGADSCSTGTLQCCDSISPNDGTDSSLLGGLIPINIQDLNVPVGVNCLPIGVLALGSTGTCSAQAACCSGVQNTGLVPIGLDCTPLNVGL